MEETSPIYFSKSAKLVVGCDSNNDDLIKYKEYSKNLDNVIFKHIIIENSNQVKDLIKEYFITVLKCDIEGFEKVLLDLTTEDLASVTKIAIEFHTQELKQLFISKIPEWGFEIVLKSSFINTPPDLGVIYGIKK